MPQTTHYPHTKVGDNLSLLELTFLLFRRDSIKKKEDTDENPIRCSTEIARNYEKKN